MPQIIMLSHAAWLQNQRRDAKIARARTRGDQVPIEAEMLQATGQNGHDVDKMTSAEYLQYLQSGLM